MNRSARTVQLDPLLSLVSFREFLDQVQDGLYVVDSDRCIVFWNRAAEQLTGFPAAHMLGRSCGDSDVLHHRTMDGRSLCGAESCPILRSMKEDAGGTVPHLILMNTASGRPLPISLSVGPLHNGDGSGIGAIALFRGMRDEYQQRRLAGEIQRRAVTARGFARNGVRVETLYAPVDEVGGDFLEAFFLDSGTLVATLADATGHGISASLFTLAYKTLLHGAFATHREPSKVLESVNRGFLETAGADGFYVGACLMSFDTVSRSGRYAAAGHPLGLVFSPDGEGFRLREKLAMRSLMLGMNEEARFGETEFSLHPSEFLLFCSDGILESPDADGTEFGVEGIERFFSQRVVDRPLDGLLAEVRRRRAPLSLLDDASALLVAPTP
jgi:PAS domain S-box-containing protein